MDYFLLLFNMFYVKYHSWRRKWQPTPIFLPGESHRQRSLAGYSPWGHKESDTTEWLTTTKIPLYCSRRASASASASPTLPGLFPGGPNTLFCSSSPSLLLSLRHSYSTGFTFTYCLFLVFGLFLSSFLSWNAFGSPFCLFEFPTQVQDEPLYPGFLTVILSNLPV